LQYAYSKKDRIFKNYPIFRGSKKDENYLKLLLEDRSHITLKFRQAVNFITGELFSKLKESFFEDKKTDIDLIEISESDYEKIIEYSLYEIKSDFEKTEDELSFAPPPIFEIDFVFSDNANDKINLLSSGESQSAHSLNAIYYHLRNIDSMNRIQLGFDYKYVNLILDEVELYHHPEMQRTYLYRLLEGIKALNLKKIKGINILFSTHSPFILSDIPSSNILRLENGKPSKKEMTQTFGANIHDLLANDFFLERGFMGEFAKEKIISLIEYLSSIKKKGKGWDIDKAQNFINMIGEPFIKGDLESLLADKLKISENHFTKEIIDKEIHRLIQLKATIK
jgi:hypothetical protein